MAASLLLIRYYALGRWLPNNTTGSSALSWISTVLSSSSARNETLVLVVLDLVEVVLFIITLQIIIFQVTKEEESELILPLMDEGSEVVQILIPTVLVFNDFILLFLVPFVGLVELLKIFRCAFDLEIFVSLVLIVVELLMCGLLYAVGLVLQW